MEDQEKQHIFRNLTELVDNTQWNTLCLSVPIETGIFSDDDSAILESIPNRRMRVLEFYRIFMTKKDSYQKLIATLEMGCQSGAANILCSLDPTIYFFQLEKQLSSCSKSEADKIELQQGDAIPIQDITESGSPCGADQTSKTIQQPSKRSNRSHNLLSVRFDVHNPTRNFTGRIKELCNLHEKLQNNAKAAVVSQMASVAGLGGIGKTELARMYIQMYSEDYENNVIWISAETKETMETSFRRLATDYLKLTQLNIDGKEKHIKTLIDEVYTFFNGKQCLFVFDNAECNEDIQEFLPLQIYNPPKILITSRDREWSFVVEMLELNEMEEIDAITLVKTGLEIQDTAQDDIILELVKTLQCFPLALSQAISYIKQQKMIYNYSIGQYLQEYKSCSEKLLNCSVGPGAVNTYTKTTLTTWKLTTELILSNKECGNEAMQILNMISYFQPEKIPRALLIAAKLEGNCKNPETTTQDGILSRITKLLRLSNNVALPATQENSPSFAKNSSKKNAKALQLLVKYSMINTQPTEQTFSIHRLVQEVTRIELRKNEQEEITLGHALKLMSENLELNCINHFCSIFDYCKGFRKLVMDFKNVPWRIMQKFDLEDTSTRYLGVGIGNELKEILQKHISSGDRDAIKLEYEIAVANYKVGNYEIAVNIFKQILPRYLENKADLFTKPEILDVQYFLCASLKASGKRTESLKTMLQTYESAKVVHGLNHWWTIQVLVGIATCLRELGHFKKPFGANAGNLEIFNQDLTVPKPEEIVSLLKAAYENKKHLISTDSMYSSRMFSIAVVCFDIEDYDTASTIATDVYEKGRNSNDTKIQVDSMKCLNLLGLLKSKVEKDTEAFEIYKEVHTFSSQMLGHNHLDTLVQKRNMLCKLRDLGQCEDALFGFREVLKTLMEIYPSHYHVLQTKWSIGITLFKMKRFDDSLDLLVDLRSEVQVRFGSTDPLLPEVNEWITYVEKFVSK